MDEADVRLISDGPLFANKRDSAAWRADLFIFAPADVIRDALIVQCSTVVGEVEGDAPSVRVAVVDDDEVTFTPEG